MLILAASFINGCRHTAEAPGPTNIHIARARLVGEPELSETHLFYEYATINFDVVDVLYGDFPKNKISVWCFGVTVPPKIPSEVLLILQSLDDMCEECEDGQNVKADPSGLYHALGDDAELGILEYTPEAREKVLSTPPLQLMENRRGDWLPKKKAIEIAFESARRLWNLQTYQEVSASRYDRGHAWSVYFVWSDIMGHHSILVIGDDGELKQIFPGR